MMRASFEETFTFDLLDTNDNILGRLNGVQSGGSLDYSVSADIRGSGSINLTKTGDVDWLHSRVRVYYNDIPLITAIPKIPAESYDDAQVTMQVDLYDKTMILMDDNFGNAYGVAAGSNIITAVKAVIASTGDTKINIESSSATLATTLVWEANTPKKTIVNDLLNAANYWGIWCDGLGYFTSGPYIAPSYRPVMYDFVDNEEGIYLPAFERNYDPFAVPNRYNVIGKTDGNVEALVKSAVDVDPLSPYSYPLLPWHTITLTGVEYSDAANLQEIADRQLVESRQISETFELSHPYLGFGLNQVVTFTNAKLGTRRAVVQKMTYSLQTGGLIKSTIRSLV